MKYRSRKTGRVVSEHYAKRHPLAVEPFGTMKTERQAFTLDTSLQRGLKVGFTGSRRGMTTAQIDQVAAELGYLRPSEGHHGDCVGADAEFHFLLEASGASSIAHPPEDPKLRAYCNSDLIWPERPYLVRNRDIVMASNLLIATPKETSEPHPSRGQGTWSTIRFARKNRRVVLIVWPDGKVTIECLP